MLSKIFWKLFLVGNAGGAELVMVLRVVVVVVLLVALEGAICDVDSTKAGKKDKCFKSQ